MLHSSMCHVLLNFMFKAAGTYSSANYPFSVAGFKELDIVVMANNVSADDTITVTIYKTDSLGSTPIILKAFDAITEASVVSQDFASNIGDKIYAEAVVAGAAEVSCSCTVIAYVKT